MTGRLLCRGIPIPIVPPWRGSENRWYSFAATPIWTSSWLQGLLLASRLTLINGREKVLNFTAASIPVATTLIPVTMKKPICADSANCCRKVRFVSMVHPYMSVSASSTRRGRLRFLGHAKMQGQGGWQGQPSISHHRWSSKATWMRLGWMRGSIYWVRLVWGQDLCCQRIEKVAYFVHQLVLFVVDWSLCRTSASARPAVA